MLAYARVFGWDVNVIGGCHVTSQEKLLCQNEGQLLHGANVVRIHRIVRDEKGCQPLYKFRFCHFRNETYKLFAQN